MAASPLRWYGVRLTLTRALSVKFRFLPSLDLLAIQTLPLAFLAAFLAAGAHGQSVTGVLKIDEFVPGVGRVFSFSSFAVNNSGQWIVSADMTPLGGSPGFGDFAVLGSQGPVVVPGQPIAGSGGFAADFFSSLLLTADGVAISSASLLGVPSSERSVLLVNDAVGLRSGFPVNAAGLPGTATWNTSFRADRLTEQGQLLVTGDVSPDGTGGGLGVNVRYDVVMGQVTAGMTLLTEDDVLPGQSAGSITVRGGDLNAAGESLRGIVASGSPQAGALYLDNTLLAQEGAAAPVAGRVWDDTVSLAQGSLNSRGDSVFAGRLQAFNSTDWILVRGVELFRQPGETLPDIAPFEIERLTTSSVSVVPDRPIMLEDGRVAWAARWTDPDTASNSGLFIDDRLVLRSGMALGGQRVLGAVFPGTWRISANGRWVIFESTIREGSGSAERVVALADLSRGTVLCSPAIAHSGGEAAEITANAPEVLAGQPLFLNAYRLPRFQTGYFLGSMTQGFMTAPGMSQGNLCLGGAIGRFIGQIMNTGFGGTLTATVDTSAIPVTPNRPVQPGETWTFQAWFRDQNPGPTSNFSSAIEVVF